VSLPRTKPPRPLAVAIGDEAFAILHGLRRDTGRTYDSIILQSLMLYRASLRARPLVDSGDGVGPSGGPLSDTLAGVMRKMATQARKGSKNAK
jgi:hypothetical protein